jgi:hypothetical protein
LFFKAAIKNNEHWNENDIVAIVEYSAIYAFSASMSSTSRNFLNEWWRSKFQVLPAEATVLKILC